jgi:N-succinyldiaminopimelate aminotransferase
MPATFDAATTAMNPDLNRLQPYPFQKLASLFRDITANRDYRAISLSIGEPKHATPQFISAAQCV